MSASSHQVNNAGMNMGKVPHEDLEGIDDAKMRAVFDLNVFAGACAPSMVS